MAVVVDNSVVLAWLMVDEEHPLAEAAIEHVARNSGVAPHIWWYELRNALVVNERRGRIRSNAVRAMLSDVQDLEIELDRDHNEANVLALARRQNISFYDASYLETAQRRGLPLATLDQRLANACQSEGITMLET